MIALAVVFAPVLVSMAVHAQQIQPTAQSRMFPMNSIINKANINEFGGTIPLGRVHHSLASSTKYIISYGGYRTDGSLSNEIELYDKMTQQWSGVLTSTECCDAAGNIISTLGNGVSGFDHSDSNHNFDTTFSADEEIDNIFSNNGPEHTEMNPIPSNRIGYEGDIPLARAEHGAVVVTNGNHLLNSDTVSTGLHERMYMFGGVTEEYEYMNDLYYFDLHTLQWHVVDVYVTTNSPSATLPGRRAGHSMVANVTAQYDENPNSNIHTTEFYIVGGRGSGFGKDVFSYNDVWRFSVTTNQWTCLSVNNQQRTNTQGLVETPAGRQYAATTILHDRIWMFGGIDPVSSTVFNDVWSFHVRTRQWRRHSENSGSVTGYSPPPLYYAHLIPITRSNDIPTDSVHVPPSSWEINQTGVSTHPETSVGFFVYGGLGAGGSCSRIQNNQSNFQTKTVFCTPLEITSMGQLYRFTVDLSTEGVSNLEYGVEEDSMNIKDLSIFDRKGRVGLNLGSNIFTENVQEDGGVAKVSWDYCRMATDSMYGAGTASTEQTPYVGKYYKTYAFERIVYDGYSGQIFELGGMTVLDNVERDTGGYLARVSWDIHSGEELRPVGNLPVNTLQWIYSDGFSSTQPQKNHTVVKFLHTFKIFSVASDQDMILLVEKYVE